MLYRKLYRKIKNLHKSLIYKGLNLTSWSNLGSNQGPPDYEKTN